ncbi:hypothetical protein GCM10027073_37390 [Streptomyces chlorus]
MRIAMTAVLAAAVAGVAGPAGAVSRDPVPRTERISVAPDGTGGNSHSVDPVVSVDRRLRLLLPGPGVQRHESDRRCVRTHLALRHRAPCVEPRRPLRPAAGPAEPQGVVSRPHGLSVESSALEVGARLSVPGRRVVAL